MFAGPLASRAATTTSGGGGRPSFTVPQFELVTLDSTVKGGLPKVLSDLAAGRLRESPSPAEAMDQLRDHVRGVTSNCPVELGPGEEHQDQPVDVLLLGSVLRALGDPDWEVMRLYAEGSRLG